jgi:hypothetical protein
MPKRNRAFYQDPIDSWIDRKMSEGGFVFFIMAGLMALGFYALIFLALALG